MNPTDPNDLLAALGASLADLTNQRDAARADITRAEDEAAAARADVVRLTSELDEARATPGFVNVADITRLTTDLGAAQVAAARAEATADAYSDRLDLLNDRLTDADQNIEAVRVLLDAERQRHEALALDLANQRVEAAEQQGRDNVAAEALRGQNLLVTERARQKWSWWAVVLVYLAGIATGLAMCLFCLPCGCKGKKPAPVPVAIVDPAPAPVEPAPAPVPLPAPCKEGGVGAVTIGEVVGNAQ